MKPDNKILSGVDVKNVYCLIIDEFHEYKPGERAVVILPKEVVATVLEKVVLEGYRTRSEEPTGIVRALSRG